jgi:hypothetical protein
MQDENQLLSESQKILDENMDNPEVRKAISANAKYAADALGSLLYSRNENVVLAAARDILDRSGYKPIERKDITSMGNPLNPTVNIISDDELTKILDAYAGRRNAIPGELVGGTENPGTEEDIL